MNPVSGGLALQAGSAILGGIAGKQQAEAEQENARINAFIGRTRAMQTDANARRNLNDEEGSMSAVFGANEMRPGVGTLEVLNELRETRNRERSIEFSNRVQEAASFDRRAQAAGQRGRQALIGGGLKAAPSLFDLYQYQSRRV